MLKNRRIKKVLIANRGEVALRIIRTCKEMGIQSVAVFSEVDRLSCHVRQADEAYLIGPSAPAESYLSIEKLLKVARTSGCNAVHPGYGFLSENPDFALAVEGNGKIFIGPSADSIQAMGDKLQARAMMRQAGVPIIPGSEAPVRSPVQARRAAEKVGYPVLLKAAGGGGGKGMRIAHEEKEMLKYLDSGRREAKSAFGDDRIYIEKYLSKPRHIEVQVLVDRYGNAVHLGERECSIQRRFQKIIEESPSTCLDDTQRKMITDATLMVARSCGYFSAGTVEFLVDGKKNFYFLEMNTRLQVEHPVTEMRTGIDIVREQILIAEGQPLRHSQADIQPRGHAIECRIYAEDPGNDFLPSAGWIDYLRPAQGPGVRIDSALDWGTEITYFYDPLISKLICWGQNRDQALRRTDRALREYSISGVKTTIPFCLFVLNHPAFRKGEYDTQFIPRYYSRRDALLMNGPSELAAVISSGLFALKSQHDTHRIDFPSVGDGQNGWKAKRLEQFSE